MGDYVWVQVQYCCYHEYVYPQSPFDTLPTYICEMIALPMIAVVYSSYGQGHSQDLGNGGGNKAMRGEILATPTDLGARTCMRDQPYSV